MTLRRLGRLPAGNVVDGAAQGRCDLERLVEAGRGAAHLVPGDAVLPDAGRLGQVLLAPSALDRKSVV